MVASSRPLSASRALLSRPRTTSLTTCSGTLTRGTSAISSHHSNALLLAPKTAARPALLPKPRTGPRASKTSLSALAPQRLEQRARDVSHVARLLQHLLQVAAQRGVFLAFFQQHLDAAGHDRQRIVELVHEAGRELAQEGELMRQPGLLVRGRQFFAQSRRPVAHGLQLQLQLFRLFPGFTRLAQQLILIAAGNQKRRKRRERTRNRQNQTGGQSRGRKRPSQDPAKRQSPDPAEPKQTAPPTIRAAEHVVAPLRCDHMAGLLRSWRILTWSLRHPRRNRSGLAEASPQQRNPPAPRHV